MELIHPLTKKKIQLEDFDKFEDIPNLMLEDQDYPLTKIQSNFYNDVQFPNYNNINDFGSLIDKSISNKFIKSLDDEIGYGKKICEIGCGTGQLSIFLSRYKREISGIDISRGSLITANNFCKKNNIKNVNFYRMSVFNMFFKNNQFDVVISNGVLHHTQDCRKSFTKLTKIVKPGGLVVIGLYHKYGRVVQKIRQFFFPILKEKLKFFDRRFSENISDKKKYAWFLDQYNNPHESTHLYSEIIKWFEMENIDFLSSLPFDNIEEGLLKRKKIIKNPELFFKEIKLMFDLQQIYEGGFFIMIGKKRK